MINTLLKAEYLFVFLLCVFAYNLLQGNWILFILLSITPDISMIGYLKNKEIGAIIYNLVHNYVLAAILIVYGFIINNYYLEVMAIVLASHVSIDRFFGFGLKKTTGFKDTHLVN